MVKALQACQNTLRIRTPPFFNEIRSLKKKKPVTHPSLPSLTKAGMDNNVDSSFQRLSLLTSGEQEEEAPGIEVA